MSRVLLLNTTYEPLLVLEHRRAFSMLYQGRATRLTDYEDRFILAGEPIPVPAVVRLVRRVEFRPSRTRPTRKAVLLRDAYCCVYCGAELNSKTATIDHVLPKSRGGKNTWENLVTACGPCNHGKGDYTPDEARMSMTVDLTQTPWIWSYKPEKEWLQWLK